MQAKFVPQTKGIATNEDLGHSGRRAGIDGRLGAGAEPAANKPKVDEKAYKAALERIPEPKDKYDPWGGARPSEPAKKPK